MYFFQSSNIVWWPYVDADLFTDEQREAVESSAEMLFGLIHARYILTSKGMNAMVLLLRFQNSDTTT